MRSTISFVLDGKLTTLDCAGPEATPTTTVLNYLRTLPSRQGTKRGCDEGDCGACTVVLGRLNDAGSISYEAVTSCLMFLPMLHGKQVITVEDLRDARGELHPVQHSMVEHHGSQCGFCTPGIVMSLFGVYKNSADPDTAEIYDALTGNLCRCTGYDDIIRAARQMHANNGSDHFIGQSSSVAALLKSIGNEPMELSAPGQRYCIPATVREAVSLLASNPGALLLNGSTDIGLRVTKRYEELPFIIDLSAIAELQNVSASPGGMRIGAGLKLQQVMKLAQLEFPALHKMLGVFGSRQIRQLATLGGNLGTASPISDTPPVLIAYNASVALAGPTGERTVPLREYITGYRTTVRRPDEIITAILLPKPNPDTEVRSYKIAKRHDFDIATVSGGFAITRSADGTVIDCCLAYGGMAASTKRAVAAERAIIGKRWTRETAEEAVAAVDNDFSPISDVRAGAAMRKAAARNLILKFWTETGVESKGYGNG